MVSACIITKNEIENIKKCLAHLNKAGFASPGWEIVVVDTGSKDGTREFLEQEVTVQSNLKLYEFSWQDDFATAKNYAVSKATNDIVLVVDSDEFLGDMGESAIHEWMTLIDTHPNQIGRVKRINVVTRNGIRQLSEEWINRVFSKSHFHYVGKIHEQLERIDGEEYDTYLTNVVMEHSGYDLPEEKLKEKADRNRILLEQELAELRKLSEQDKAKMANHEAYVLYQLAKSHYMAKQYAEAVDYFGQALSFDLNPKLEFVQDAVETYGYALVNNGQADVAMGLEAVYEEFSPSADFVFMMGIVYMNNALFERAIEEFEKATHHKSCKMRGVNSFLAYYNNGVIYECLGNLKDAKAYYCKCGDYTPALERMGKC